MRRWLTWLNCGTDQVFGLPYAPGVPTSDHHPKPPPPDWWTGGQAQPPRAPEVPTSDHYPTSELAADVQLIPEVESLVRHALAELAERPEWETIVGRQIAAMEQSRPTTDREAWLLGQLVEARRQLDAGIDRLRALEERLST